LNTQQGRRDHFLPQGYLRGFIDPARRDEPQPLWSLDIPYKKWSERSTKQLGHITGLYDYAGTGPEVESLPSADETFSDLENGLDKALAFFAAIHGHATHSVTSVLQT
jgi:hypothetical protein